MQELFSWQMLMTIGGASMATGLLTHFLKDITYLKSFPTQILSYFVALIVLVSATFFANGPDVSALFLCLFNAFVVSGAASNTVSAYTRLRKPGD